MKHLADGHNWGDFETNYNIQHDSDNLQVGVFVQRLFYKETNVT
jgi:hypothetical protein